MTRVTVIDEIRRRYAAGEREIHVSAAAFACYAGYLTAERRVVSCLPDGAVPVNDIRCRLMFKDAEVWTERRPRRRD